jgi:hypothetical protein
MRTFQNNAPDLLMNELGTNSYWPAQGVGAATVMGFLQWSRLTCPLESFLTSTLGVSLAVLLRFTISHGFRPTAELSH